MGNFQKFRSLIFADGRSRAAPSTLPVGSTSYCMQPTACEMARELHTMEGTVCVYHVYKETWCAAAVLDHLLRDQLIDRVNTMAMPPVKCVYLGCEYLRVDIYLASLILAFCQSTAKKKRENRTPQKFPTIWYNY